MSSLRHFKTTLTERAMLFSRSLNNCPPSHRQRIADGMNTVYPPAWAKHPCIYSIPVTGA